jgi:UDP-N-acetylmuramoyl-L-alanyl-D-glutamate--2,6-diaminopimelate ligase
LRLSELKRVTEREATDAGRLVPADPTIAGLATHSRAVQPGYLFAALPGTATDGRAFIADAVARGAAAVLVGPGPLPDGLDPSVAVIVDPEPRRRLALMAAAFAGAQPATMVAVTGTSGKSSTVHFTRELWSRLGIAAASIGTLGIVSPTIRRDSGLTTPDPIALHADLAALARSGVDHAALEASSHGLDQHRLDGVRFSAAAFLNLTHEHLDYHGTTEAYFAAKARLFGELLPAGGTAIVNADQPYAARLEAICRGRGITAWTFGAQGRELRLERSVAHARGQHLALEIMGHRHDIDLPLAGAFQASNVLASLGLVLAGGADADRAVAALAGLSGARGRLELVARSAHGAPVYVDYAHKPQALETVLATLRPAASGRLVVVFGCGGDRDRAKRPLMGEIATRLADLAIVTDDNPRSEDPAAIRAEIMAGVPAGRGNAVEIAAGRREAIRAGLDALVSPGDLLVIAGKGHESGQTIAGVTHPFDDAEVARALIAGAPTAEGDR